jgi:ionotropic glutamate receptor
MEALKSELKFALNLWITTKPVHKNLSEGSSRSRLHVDSETHSTKESLNSVKVDNENDKIGGKSKSLLNLNKVLDLARQKHSAT